MQMNEIVGQDRSGPRLPNRQLATSTLRDTLETRAERPASQFPETIAQDPNDRQAAAEPARKLRRYGAGF
jgi:hypothetical protein